MSEGPTSHLSQIPARSICDEKNHNFFTRAWFLFICFSDILCLYSQQFSSGPEFYFNHSTILILCLPDSSLFVDGDGNLKTEGDLVMNPLLAATMRRLAIEGVDIFYTGDIAQTLVEETQNIGMFLFILYNYLQ